MGYLAYYRAFRPTNFDEVVRQEHIVQILKNQIKEDKVGHAYLFCGPRGTGKTTLAKIFARAVNCESPKDGSPCGVCPTCKAMLSGSLDISEIDAASNNSVDEMRDLREKIQYPPVNGRYKVYIIDEVHMLSSAAFNAVLKTLEEPPAHAMFILATTEPQKIPATILSRCMRFDFKLIPREDLEGLIRSVFDKTGKKYEEEAVTAIARAGAGSARDSLSIADMCASFSEGVLTYEDVNEVLGSADFGEIATVVESMLNEDGRGSLMGVENILSTGKSVGVLVRDLLNFLNWCAIAKMCANAEDIINLPKDRFDRLCSIAASFDGHKILRVSEVLAKAENDLRYALNGRITLETAVLRCAMPSADYDIEAILGRIAYLEKQIESGAVTITRYVDAVPQIRDGSQVPASETSRVDSQASSQAASRTSSPTSSEVAVQSRSRTLDPVDGQTAPVSRISARDASQNVSDGDAQSVGGTMSNFGTGDIHIDHNTVSDDGATYFSDDSSVYPFGVAGDYSDVMDEEERRSGSNSGSNLRSGETKDDSTFPDDVFSMSRNADEPSFEDPDAMQSSLFETGAVPASVESKKPKTDSATAVQAKFIRALRTTHSNATLFTLCMDLTARFEGGKFLLITDNEMAFRGLNREDNKIFCGNVLNDLGIDDFDIRLETNVQGDMESESQKEDAVKIMQENFGADLKIE